MPIPLLLDTDIGTNVDDLFALAFALGSPEFDLISVTTVGGVPKRRALLAARLLHESGRPDVPVASGEADPLTPGLSRDDPEACGHGIETSGVNGGQIEARPAVSLLLEKIAINPGATVCAVGPLTNLAMLARRFPAAYASIGRISIMGGNYVGEGARSIEAEGNFSGDPEAAAVVLSGPAPVWLLGKNVTRQTELCPADLDDLEACETEVGKLLARAGRHYLQVKGRTQTPMHDSLALAALLDPRICSWKLLEPYVQTVGREAGVVTFQKPSRGGARPVRVATDVDAARFQQLFLERIKRLARKS